MRYGQVLSPVTLSPSKLDALRGILPAVLGVDVRDHVTDGEYVASRFTLKTFGPIDVLDRFRVVNGLLAEIRPYYDPRIITEGMRATAS
jgi:hypothetical protein